MIRALFSAASGMNAQQTNVENIANNIANANTAGFKARRAQFQDLLYQNLIQPGAAATQKTVVPTGLQLGLGTRAVSNEVIFTQGDFSETDNPLDLVIQGNGFFQVLQPSGQLAYTKAGTFHLNNTGQIVDPNGNLLDPPITIPQNALSFTIGSDGTVSYTLPGQAAAQQAGQIQLANFVNPSGLNSIGSSLFQQTDASGAPSDWRTRRCGWRGHVAARLCGAIQRQHRSGIRELDRQSARLRSELQGGKGRRRHVSTGE
jgi:flagellar basal-body rod protein FlgG